MNSPKGTGILIFVVAYGILARLCFCALWCDTAHPVPAWVLILGVVLATVYGAGEERHQSFILWRESSRINLAADGVGAAVAAVVWEPLTRRYKGLR